MAAATVSTPQVQSDGITSAVWNSEQITKVGARMFEVANAWTDQLASGKPDRWEAQRGIMSNIHAALWLGVKQQYRFAHQIKENELSGWIKYCKLGFDGVHHHHHMEESLYFPELCKRRPAFQAHADRNIAQHADFHDSLEQLLAYFTAIDNTLSGKTTSEEEKKIYSPDEHIKLLDIAVPFMMPHFDAELDTLSAETLRDECGFTIEEVEEVATMTDKEAKSQDPFATLPFLLGHCSNQFMEYLLPLPARALTRAVFSRRHAAAWQFCPFSPFILSKSRFTGVEPFYRAQKTVKASA